jgi:transcriptional regulator with XRE-family HTH domain
MKDTANESRLGAALRALRKERGWTLAEVSRRTGFSIPTLSKVENNRLSLSYDKLIRVSEGLDVDIAQLFSPAAEFPGAGTVFGRRSVNRRGEGELVPTQNYDYRYLSTDLTHKKFIPILTEVRARSPEQFGDLVRHTGEEFVYVLEGEVEIRTELYAPLTLTAGESAYLDSSMGHAYLAKGDGPCRLLAVCSASERDLRAVMARSELEGSPPQRQSSGRPESVRELRQRPVAATPKAAHKTSRQRGARSRARRK